MIGKAFLVAVVAFLIYLSVSISLRLGLSTHYHKHYPGECRQVQGIEFGSEDLEVTTDGLAFISSGVMLSMAAESFKNFVKTNSIKGNIFLFDLNKPKSEAVKLKLKKSKDFNPDTFHPHGLSLLEDKVKGEHLLYVINHAFEEDDRVEKFRFLPKTRELQHIKSFFSDKFTTTNDLAVVGEDKFYITNFMYFNEHVLAMFEQILALPLCSVVFFNGTGASEVLSGIVSPNGVFFSKDKRYLYVSMPLHEAVKVYGVKEDNSLALVQSVSLYTLVDNLHLSQSGDALFIGSQPIGFKLIQHLDDPSLSSPSKILHAPLRNGKVVTEEITEVFYDHGDLITASTVAAMYKNHLLIGSLIDKLVICTVNVKF